VSIRWTPTLVTLVTLAVALLWARQQANANLLMHG
jgi:hypothetical protein